MPQPVSELIYQAFFERLSHLDVVRPETIQSLKALYETSQIATKAKLTRLTQEIEARHAQDQETNR